MFDQLYRSGWGDRRGRRRSGEGRGEDDKSGSGPGGSCLCPNCGYKKSHPADQICTDASCPQCGSGLVKQ